MKSYIRNHILSSFIIALLGFGGAHFLVTSLQSASSSASQRQEISTLLQQPPSTTGAVPTLGQIGKNLGGFFQNIAP